MSGKSLKDEKQDLQKQIGCIAGFFQLFDRHRFLTTSSHIQHTPSSGGSNDDIKEFNSSTMQKTKAKNVKIAREKQQFPTESSITSVSSSSCSSSISSLELNRATKTKSPSTSQIRIQQNQHSQTAMKQHDVPNKQSVDFHDIVKDSMHREAQGLSVKTVAKQEKKGPTYALKRIDSPRPLQPHKSVNAGVMVDSEPINIISKSKRTPWDSPRLSYDGRYTQDTWKSTSKVKELPRLSLDSKERSIRGVNEGNKSRNLLNGTQKVYRKNSCTTLNQLQEPETSRRSSSVVAKLMGLEALPDLAQPFETPHETSSCSSNKEVLMEKSNTSSDIKSKGSVSDIKSSKSSLSVYGEIEKRLAELEFKKSGKDLRALKQILEAMQRYQDSPSDNKSNASLSETSRVQSPRILQKDLASVTVEISNSTKSSKLPIIVMKPTRATRKANSPLSSNATKAKGISATTKSIKDSFGQPISSSDRNSNLRTSKMMQSSKVPQDRTGKNSTNSCNMTVTGSPGLQRKFGFEKPSPPASPSSYSSINRRQQNRQHVELSSSSTTCRQNFSNLQDRNERFNEVSHHWRNFKHHVNVISSDFDSNRSLATHGDIEVIQIDKSGNIKSSSIQLRSLNQNGTFEKLRKKSSKAEKIITSEQPSPVSVLDDAFYREDPPSPVRKKSNISKNFGEALSTDDDSEENSVDLPSCTTNANSSNGSSDMDMNTQNLNQILQEIDWLDEKLLNLNNSKNPVHKYISEILLASGVLSGRSSSEILHSTGHLLNPKLFFALEQMKTMKRSFNIEDRPVEQLQRKLIFDVVNDILVQKLIVESSSTLWCLPNELAGRKLKGKQFLEDLCTEIDQLQPQNRNVSFVHEDENFTSLLSRDLKHDHTIWTNCSTEMPNVALDIERLIFKDLITEVVRDELSNNFGSHCRQLLFRK